MRVAVYYAPALNDPLWQAGCAWLGRDSETAATLPQPDLPGLAALTAEPRRYGFHATLKPPMRLASAYPAFLQDVQALAKTTTPFELPTLAVADLSGFLALRETTPCPALHALADACVTALDTHRAPSDPAELARRRGRGLPAAQETMLLRWGYPHVLQTWFFHMTLTRRLQPEERDRVHPAATAWFAPALARPRRVESICIFTQATSDAPFLLAERVPLSKP